MNTRRIVLAVILVFACGGRAAAQSTHGAVVGTESDTSGAVLPGATVTLTDTLRSFARTTMTDANGSFEFQNLTRDCSM